MAVNTANAPELAAAVKKYLGAFPGDLICARQLWYEGLDGQGAANPEQVAAIEKAIADNGGWKNVGDVRYEKFGSQNSFKKA
ncbi:MAG: hypothetical protein LBS90_00915 [Oscillospiraceae bacterium]|nr:hypothetical protein [Oscillospiraceae bacterium]